MLLQYCCKIWRVKGRCLINFWRDGIPDLFSLLDLEPTSIQCSLGDTLCRFCSSKVFHRNLTMHCCDYVRPDACQDQPISFFKFWSAIFLKTIAHLLYFADNIFAFAFATFLLPPRPCAPFACGQQLRRSPLSRHPVSWCQIRNSCHLIWVLICFDVSFSMNLGKLWSLVTSMWRSHVQPS